MRAVLQMGKLIYLFNTAQTDLNQKRFEDALELCSLGRAASTKSKCKYLLVHWINLYGYLINPEERQVLQFLEHSKNKLKLSNKTIKSTLQLLKRIYTQFEMGHVFDKAISLVRTNDKIPEKRACNYIPFDSIMTLVNCPDTTTPIGRRDQCLICLMLGGALRISECLNLKIGDIRETVKGTLFVYLRDTKKGVPAEQPIVEQFYDIIRGYKAERLAETGDEDQILLTSYSLYGKYKALNKKTIRRSISRRFQTYTEKVGLKNISPHSCRRTIISKMLSAKEKISYKEVQEFSRHESIAMVELYDKRLTKIDDSPGKKIQF